MSTIDKWVMVGYVKAGYPERDVQVFVHIKWDGRRLSLSGVEGPKANGDAHGGCGQIDVSRAVPLDSGVDTAKLATIWDRWHLNDMRAGSRAQESYLRRNPIDMSEYARAHPERSPSYYEAATAKLHAVGLNPDPLADGYCYGSAWKFEDVPEDVIAYLASLPSVDAPRGWL